MNSNTRFLYLLFRFTKLTPDMFYNIEIKKNSIALQGEYDSVLCAYLCKKKFTAIVTEYGHVNFQKINSNLKITLT